MNKLNRRDFLRTSVMGGIAVSCFNSLTGARLPEEQGDYPAKVTLTYGDSRADIVFRALQPFSEQIKKAIGKKHVILKPNNVTIENQLACTHAETLEGILEFLKSINKTENVIIAESAATGPTFDGYENFGYSKLTSRYPVKLMDLDKEPYQIIYVFDEKDFRPHPVRVSSIILNPDSYIISVARMKTHDRIIATLSLKNIILGAPIKDIGFSYGPNRKKDAKNDKPIVHGSGFRGLNYNLYALARQMHPDLAIVDGFQGMEGNGPGNGTPVDHRICVAGTDWLATDRVAVELMGIDFTKIGYLNYCAQTGMGVADLKKIEIVGEPLGRHIKSYKLPRSYDSQLIWMSPVS
jgi:uncharacterized protein (DUF362 family)